MKSRHAEMVEGIDAAQLDGQRWVTARRRSLAWFYLVTAAALAAVIGVALILTFGAP